MSLGAGWHLLDARPWITVETATLVTGAVPARASSATTTPSFEVVSSDPTRLRLRVRARAGGAVLVNGQSYDPQWRARTGGRDLGAPQPLDTQNGWVIPDEGEHVVDVNYRPQRIYQMALGLTVGGIAACAWLAVRRRRA